MTDDSVADALDFFGDRANSSSVSVATRKRSCDVSEECEKCGSDTCDGDSASEAGEECDSREDVERDSCEGVELVAGVKLSDGTKKKKKRKKKKRKLDHETKELLRRQEVNIVPYSYGAWR